jgi:acetyl-CoA carboxylase biotin carboxyl carrier protein
MKSKKAPVAKVKAQPVSSGMNLNDIESLIKFVQSSGVSEVSLEQKDFKLTIKTSHGASMMPVHNPTVHQFVHTPAPAPAAVQIPAERPAQATEKAAVADDSKYVTIKSPMIGTFYRASTPEKPVFVNVGDEIKPGKVLCIIEAMKLFNEIESEVAGKIVKVLVDNATPVEYDQPLFLVDPS